MLCSVDRKGFYAGGMTPQLRLISRAVITALLSFLGQLEASQTWDASLLRSAITGAVLAAIEYLTPVNAAVGPGKAPDAVQGTDPL